MLWHDLRGAFRQLVRAPAFAASVVLPLALALGANTAIFSVIRGVLLRPLPYPEADRLVRIYRAGETFQLGSISPLDYRDDLAPAHRLRGVAAWRVRNATIGGEGTPEHIMIGVGSASLLPTLRLTPALGRWFDPDEEEVGQDRRVVLSHALWIQRFNGDPRVVGRTVQLDGDPYEVAGVLPSGAQLVPGTDLPEAPEAWIPLSFQPSELQPMSRNFHTLQVVARLAPGETLAQARQELSAAARQTVIDHPDAYPPGSAFLYRAVPLLDDVVKDVRPTLMLMFAAIGLVLLMACANVGNLLLARATTRDRELAVRSALGASRGELARQLLVESLLLALLAGGLGIWLANASVDVLQYFVSSDLPRAGEIDLDGHVLAFALIAAVGSGVAFGLVPALTVSEVNLDEALRGGAASSKPRPRRLRRALVVLDVALALLLLCGAALLLRSFSNAIGLDPGIQSQGVLSFRAAVPIAAGVSESEAKTRFRLFFEQSLQRLSEIPGVESVGAINSLPFSMYRTDRGLRIAGTGGEGESDRPDPQFRVVTPGYFETVRMRLVKGRWIQPTDNESAPPVVVVNEAFERKWFKGNALGQQIRLWSPDGPWCTIIGVAGNTREFGLDASVEEFAYFPLAQNPAGAMSFVVHSSRSLPDLAGPIKTAISSVNANVPIFRMGPLDTLVHSAMAQRRFTLLLVAAFAGVAVLLAALGLYGVVAYSVRQRTREIGVRMALGAAPAKIVEMVARESVWMVGVGAAAGVIGALTMNRLLANFLFGVGPTDPWSFLAAGVVLVVAAALATALPLWRATRVDAGVALAAE